MKQKDNLFIDDLYNIQVLCIYGETDNDFYSFLQKWLKENKDRKIFFLEDDINKYEKSLKLTQSIFKAKNVKNILIQNDLHEILKKIAWESTYLNLKIFKSSLEKRDENFTKISQILNDLHLGVNITSYLYSDFGIKVFENVYNNLLKTDSFIFFERLCNKFKNIPAIIAGAGPSLDKNIHLLKEVNNKALMFVGGSALNIFSAYNIRHHFSGHIDQSHLFKRFKNNNNFEDIFFYTNQMSHYNFSLLHSNKVLVSDYGAYPLKSWIYDQLNMKQDIFEAGWNVTTFLIKIATILGCNPIYFVGLDLCFKNDKYAKGVTKIIKPYENVKLKNINNEDVYSQKDWILAKKWIEEFALNNKNTKFINTTEDGLKIENIDNLKLSEIIPNLKNNLDLFGFVHTVFEEEEKIKLDRTQILQILNKIQESFKKADILCDEYLDQIKKNNLDESLLKFQKEIVYIYLLDPLWEIWKYVILRKVEDNQLHILINKLIFFKTVISNHLKILRDIL